jgi:hypothetical protein
LLSIKLVLHAAFSQVTKNRAAPNSAMHTSISRAEPKKAVRRNRLRLKISLIGFVLCGPCLCCGQLRTG